MGHTKICEDIEQEGGREGEYLAGFRDSESKSLNYLDHKDVWMVSWLHGVIGRYVKLEVEHIHVGEHHGVIVSSQSRYSVYLLDCSFSLRSS